MTKKLYAMTVTKSNLVKMRNETVDYTTVTQSTNLNHKNVRSITRVG